MSDSHIKLGNGDVKSAISKKKTIKVTIQWGNEQVPLGL